MNNRYFKIDIESRYVVNVTVGPSQTPGVEAVQQTAELRHIGVGWSYVDGQFSDTRAAYRAHLAAIRENSSQGFLASLPEG